MKGYKDILLGKVKFAMDSVFNRMENVSDGIAV